MVVNRHLPWNPEARLLLQRSMDRILGTPPPNASDF
jgi:hypothetical protein